MCDECVPTVLAAMRPLIDDIEGRLKVRKCSIVPISVACAALVEMGRQESTSAILKALSTSRAVHVCPG